MGYTVRRVAEAPDLPDRVFVEDTAVIFPEIGIITRPGANSRMAEVLKEYCKPLCIDAPDTIDDGDVLTLGKRIYIDISHRNFLMNNPGYLSRNGIG